jgi:hypothetical protein
MIVLRVSVSSKALDLVFFRLFGIHTGTPPSPTRQTSENALSLSELSPKPPISSKMGKYTEAGSSAQVLLSSRGLLRKAADNMAGARKRKVS